MRIALDYDGTFTEDPELWLNFALLASARGHQVRIVTFRKAEEIKGDILQLSKTFIIIPTGRVAKKEYCSRIGWEPDVWIDDLPELIIHGSNWTDDEYNKWRQDEGLFDRESEESSDS